MLENRLDAVWHHYKLLDLSGVEVGAINDCSYDIRNIQNEIITCLACLIVFSFLAVSLQVENSSPVGSECSSEKSFNIDLPAVGTVVNVKGVCVPQDIQVNVHITCG